ncbi:Wzz/FepE/Etk N-terminal domain-containing protein [Acidithiobacillus acidisediminis]|uniref:Wzz/FepE/Etk N-terminal domain-containing protein n=1 Tax=Acidithiobacillus acidisediminis TaxID=2937799 RepID=UPI003D667118
MNASTQDEVSLYDLFATLRRQKWVILGFVLLFILVAIAYALLRPREYACEACVSMGIIGRTTTGDLGGFNFEVQHCCLSA